MGFNVCHHVRLRIYWVSLSAALIVIQVVGTENTGCHVIVLNSEHTCFLTFGLLVWTNGSRGVNIYVNRIGKLISSVNDSTLRSGATNVRGKLVSDINEPFLVFVNVHNQGTFGTVGVVIERSFGRPFP